MDDQIKTIYDVESIMISNSAGQQFRLDEMASISRGNSAGEIHRRERQKLITIAADIQDRTLGDVDKEISQRLQAMDLPHGITIKSGADQENMRTGFSSLIKALILSILLIYMILVVLYESYLTPLIRMMSIPCGFIGALSALAITHNTLNIVTLIGFIMLDGLASKNGTLLIDYTHTLMKRGMPLREALIQSGTTRLRPILMTSAAMIVGMLPVALAMGAGSEIKAGMAIALIGGIVTATLFSPILLPVVYTLMNDLKTHISNRKKGLEVQI
jgi:HAE1 family hydrophobic/amphiphilic exporter-1